MTLKPQELPHEYAPVVVRHLRNGDLAQCHRIDRYSFPESERWDEIRWHESAGTQPALVAVQGATVAGFVVYAFAPDCLELVKIAVHPRCRRNGVGTLLAGRVVETCREHHRGFVEAVVPLSTEPGHLAALSFFKALSWRGFLCPAGPLPCEPEAVRFVKENRRKN